MSHPEGIFISDFDMSAIEMHSVLELARGTIRHFEKTNDPRYEYARDLYQNVKLAEEKKNSTGEIDDILNNGTRMKILTKNIVGLPLEYLEDIRDKVNRSIMPGFDNAMSHAALNKLEPHLITMSFDYFVRDLAKKWFLSYNANSIILNDAHTAIESTEVSIPDEKHKAYIIDEIIQDYNRKYGEIPKVHIHGDGESDMDMFHKAIELLDSGAISELFIYVPENGTRHARDIATDVYPIGKIDQHLIRNTGS